MLDALVLPPIAHFAGEINLPGSKSISNRALLLAALARGTTQLDNLLVSEDVQHMLNGLQQLGIQLTLTQQGTGCKVVGIEHPPSPNRALTLFLGNAGTAMRPLTAILSLQEQTVILTGEPRMKERPIGDLVAALRQGGAQIDYLSQENYPPLRLRGGFEGGEIDISASVSSQFLTALLMAAPLATRNTTITLKGKVVSHPYIQLTLALMKDFGVEVEQDNDQVFRIQGGQHYISPGHYLVEGDASSASYFLAAAAIRGGTVRVRGIGNNSVQGDIRFAEVLASMGANITWGEDFIACRRGELHGIDMDMNHIPDAAMTIATTALFADGPTVIRNIANWRVKETDRLAAMATELRKVGAQVEEGIDFIRVIPPQRLKTAEIATYHDHRMAMCFSLVSLSDIPITILDPHCTAKTFPDYFQQFSRLSETR